ncbi:MAG: DUF4870 domain-containing protein [Verrucomicrobiales bacterium]|nr:DUF4870 domain-containing protein [Verrucomicrobiales bacterium]
MNIADELSRLNQLLKDGALTQGEFEVAKARLLQTQPAGGPPPMPADASTPPAIAGFPVEGYTPAARQWAMWLHLSSLAGYLVPLAGFVAPIVIWQVKKGEFRVLDAHGKMVVNWLISAAIYGVACFVLAFVLIGIPLLIALGLAHVVFSIIGGVKANEGILWKYPLCLQLIK